MQEKSTIPFGYCQCGCGKKTPLYQRSNYKQGQIKGQPAKYLSGHWSRDRRPQPRYEGDIVLVPLTRGYYATIDVADAERVLKFCWHAQRSHGNRFYASRRVGMEDGLSANLHRFILELPEGLDLQVDHIDGDPLNNRRSNLRLCTATDNLANRRITKANRSSRYKGVTRSPKSWGAAISRDGKEYRLGNFPTEEEAARAYDVAARILHGEFARLNFPRRGERCARSVDDE